MRVFASLDSKRYQTVYGKQTNCYKELKWKVTECMTSYLTQVYINLQIDYHNAYKGTVIVSDSTVSYQKRQ